MSIRGFVDPASCGQANPIANVGGDAAQMAKQVAESRAFQQGPTGAGLLPMGPQGPAMADMMHAAQQDHQGAAFMKNFEQGPMVGPGHEQMPFHPGMMQAGGVPDGMLEEFQRLRLAQQVQQQKAQFARAQAGMAPQGPQWARDYEAQAHPQAAQQGWAAEFAQQQPAQNSQAAQMRQHAHQMALQRMQQQQQQRMGMQRGMPMMGGMGMMGQMGGGMGMMGNMRQQQHAKIHVVEEATVEEVTNTTQQPAESEVAEAGGIGGMGMSKEVVDQLMNSDDPKWRNSKFLKFINKISKGEIEFRDNQAVEVAPKAPENAVATAAPQQTWADEYDESQALDQWAQQFNMEGLMDSDDPQAWAAALERARVAAQPADPTYAFQENNKFADFPDAFAEGVRLLKAGKLKQAIRALEAAVQQDPENAEAWRYLGQAQAENEDEKSAIAALQKCIGLDPYNLPALLMLGVSYTNDLEEVRALNYLKTWMLNNPDYQDAMAQHKDDLEQYETMYGGSVGTMGFDSSLHEQVTKMFLDATKINPTDADLYTVLGVLYHISSDYEKAIWAFRNAVKHRPEDAQLWNKLGATQANSSKSVEAVHAYKMALKLRPTYVRALANLGIAFANQNLHDDAIRTFLATLKQNPNADHIWSYLRISLSHLQKTDLVALTQKRDVELFRPHFQF